MPGLLDAMSAGRENVRELDDPALLRCHVDELMRVRNRYFDGYGLCAATAHAERLVGAAMMLDPSVSAHGVGNTLIVAVNIASGTQIARAATNLRNSGNDGVLIGVVLHSLVADWVSGARGWTVPEVDALFVLDVAEQSSGFWELTESREGSVSLVLT